MDVWNSKTKNFACESRQKPTFVELGILMTAEFVFHDFEWPWNQFSWILLPSKVIRDSTDRPTMQCASGTLRRRLPPQADPRRSSILPRFRSWCSLRSPPRPKCRPTACTGPSARVPLRGGSEPLVPPWRRALAGRRRLSELALSLPASELETQRRCVTWVRARAILLVWE